ncbi:MAG: hypothetical protein ABSB59_36320 [Streptosporangiaceae bacterium]|jgi:hypothetical protein
MSDPWPFRSSLELGALSTPQPPGPRPRPRPGEPGAEGTSDGVLLIAALSTRWDWYPTEDAPGKVVWCELSVDPLAPAEDTLELPLPRRVPRARPKPQAEIVTDLDILRRLRDHLLS